jgi:hypothetical protein
LAVAAVIEQLLQWKKELWALALLLTVIGLGIYSLPNRTILRLTGSELAWLDIQEDLREVVQYWMERHNGNEPTYVYYGAAPAFRYYLRLYGFDTDPLPPDWFFACWRGEVKEACSRNNVFYGEWFRSRSPEEKLLSMHRTLGGHPERFWLIFSHIYPGEDDMIIQGSLEKYVIALSYKQGGASVYLFERR